VRRATKRNLPPGAPSAEKYGLETLGLVKVFQINAKQPTGDKQWRCDVQKRTVAPRMLLLPKLQR